MICFECAVASLYNEVQEETTDIESSGRRESSNLHVEFILDIFMYDNDILTESSCCGLED
jgi:hypothetical protein